jgi:membrane fusion protein, multidrug efflux system
MIGAFLTQQGQSPMKARWSMTRTTPLFALATGLAAILAACDGKSVGGSASPPPPPVTVSQPLEKMITEWDEYTGRFTAVETVEIRARVSGFIQSVHFKEGQIVKQGDLLFVVDPRPFSIAVD